MAGNFNQTGCDCCSGVQCDCDPDVETCVEFSVNDTYDLDNTGLPAGCQIDVSPIWVNAEGPYGHACLDDSFNLLDYFDYVQMWDDGDCPLACRHNPREHTNGPLVIGPYDHDVEIFCITRVRADDWIAFDGVMDECANSFDAAAGTVLKYLSTGDTTELCAWETYGAHCIASGVIGVRPAGCPSECNPAP